TVPPSTASAGGTSAPKGSERCGCGWFRPPRTLGWRSDGVCAARRSVVVPPEGGGAHPRRVRPVGACVVLVLLGGWSAARGCRAGVVRADGCWGGHGHPRRRTGRRRPTGRG